jgi:hypothetical protein
MTVYIFGGKLNSPPFHQLASYILKFNDGYKYRKPKYLFLDSISSSIIAKNNTWQFPIDYKKYALGNTTEIELSRCLYVEKN